MCRVSSTLLAIGFLVALAVTGWRAPAAAQDATPVPAAVEFPIDPDPAECQVQPRSIDELIAFWFTPEGSPVPVPHTEEAPAAVTIPVGAPADEATVAAIVATVREVFACFEAGDFRRALALFTDDLARSFGPGPEATIEDVRAFLETTEPEAEAAATVIVAITDVMVLADGRVGAFVIDGVAGEGTNVAYVIFEQVGDRWLVDEVIEFDGAGGEEEDEEE